MKKYTLLLALIISLCAHGQESINSLRMVDSNGYPIFRGSPEYVENLEWQNASFGLKFRILSKSFFKNKFGLVLKKPEVLMVLYGFALLSIYKGWDGTSAFAQCVASVCYLRIENPERWRSFWQAWDAWGKYLIENRVF